MTGCKQLKVLWSLLKTLPLSRDLRDGGRERKREKSRCIHTFSLLLIRGWASSGVWDTEPEQGSFA